MPNTERVAQLADAALRVVIRDGLSAVSFRAVAAESGWSLGAVQKAFRTKHDLLEAVVDLAQQRVATSAMQPPGKPDLTTWLVDLALQMLPLDQPRRAAVLISTAYADRAGVDPSLAADLAARDAAIRERLAALFARTRSTGEHTSPLGDDALARAYLALASGLAAQLLYDPQPETDVRDLLLRAVRALLGAP